MLKMIGCKFIMFHLYVFQFNDKKDNDKFVKWFEMELKVDGEFDVGKNKKILNIFLKVNNNMLEKPNYFRGISPKLFFNKYYNSFIF